MRIILVLLMVFLLSASAIAVPCHDPKANFEGIRLQVFQDPAKAMKKGRMFFAIQKPRCGFQWALGVYLTESIPPEDAPWMKAMQETDSQDAYEVITERSVMPCISRRVFRRWPGPMKSS
jgi:hypothetical protein